MEETDVEEQINEESGPAEPNEEAVEQAEEEAETSDEEEGVEDAAEEKIEAEEELPPVEEEIKPPRREEVEEEIVEERFYTIPLRKAWIAPSKKRVPRAMKIMKEFLKKHMKLESTGELEEEEPKRLIISNEVNERFWRKGVQKPPRKVRVRAAKDKDGNVTVYLAEGD